MPIKDFMQYVGRSFREYPEPALLWILGILSGGLAIEEAVNGRYSTAIGFGVTHLAADLSGIAGYYALSRHKKRYL